MKYKSAIEVVESLIDAYYNKRDIETTIDCVTKDIEWIGTEDDDYASGKDMLREILNEDVKKYSVALDIEVQRIVSQKKGGDVEIITIFAKQKETVSLSTKLTLRGVVCCVNTDQGWLINNVHASVPNAELEKYYLERLLSQKQQQEETLLSSIPGGVATYRLKKNGKFATEYISESLAKMCGYTVDEFLNYLRDDAMINVADEDKEKVEKSVKSSLEANEPISAIYNIYTKSGEKILIGLDGSVMHDVKLEDDEVCVIYAVHTKISKDSQQTIKDQERYREVLNILGIAYWEWSRQGGFFRSDRYNDYAISEKSDYNILNWKDYSSTVHPDDIEIMNRFVEHENQKNVHESAALRIKMKDGSYRWTEIFSFVEAPDNYGVERIITIMRDVDKGWIIQKEQLKKALIEAEKANQAKTVFLSRVSHDMRTPLNGILGITSLLMNKVQDEDVLNDLNQLEQSGQYLLNIINDTLDVSRIESGKLELHPSVCEGKKLLDTALSLVRTGAKAKNIQLNVHVHEIPFTMLFIDVGRVEQVIMNIVGNAVKFTPEGGKIDFYIRNISFKDGVVLDEVVVCDNGIGISEEFIPHIFDAFAQEDASRTSSVQGTGLGMSITYQLLKAMGGDINIESQVGVGTKVTMRIPLAIATKKQIEEYEKLQENNESLSKLKYKKVLLCEDNSLNATIATRLLEAKGMDVEHAVNGLVGVNMYESSPLNYYDAVLMDIRMPVMDGLDAAKNIRNLDREDSKIVPIIAMTANAFKEDIGLTQEVGMDEHLSKPIEIEKLYDTLNRLIK